MDPVMAALVRSVRRMPPSRPNLPALRLQYDAGLRLMAMPSDPRPRVTEITGHGLSGRLYEPPGTGHPGLLYFHGGGFMMGSLASRDAFCRLLAMSGMRVLSVTYRLAPEHPFPAAHDDARTALLWAREVLGGRFAVGGDSAGANLAASLAHEPGVTLQVLLIPVVDMVDEPGRYPSLQRFATGYLLTADALRECASLLMPPGTDPADPRLSPIRSPVEGAAPALICVAGFDPLYDQGVAYAAALRAAGVPVVLMEESGMIHGFPDFAGLVPSARRAVDRVVAAIAVAMTEHC